MSRLTDLPKHEHVNWGQNDIWTIINPDSFSLAAEDASSADPESESRTHP